MIVRLPIGYGNLFVSPLSLLSTAQPRGRYQDMLMFPLRGFLNSCAAP